jgi:hypothetical protein
MAMMASFQIPQLSTRQHAALEMLIGDLEQVFGARLRSVVVYGLENLTSVDGLLRTMSLVEQLSPDDLHHLIRLGRPWDRRGLAAPLILTSDEFARTLDVFPLEYGNIIANHVVVAGSDPFAVMRVSQQDRRRGCELEAKSHVIHLREGYLETEGELPRVAQLIAASAPAFRTVLLNIVRLERGEAWHPGRSADQRLRDEALAAAAEDTIGISATLVTEVLASRGGASVIADPSPLLTRYLDASERIWQYVDRWGTS